MYTQSMENKTNRWWDVFVFVLLLLVLWTAAFRLEVTHWTKYLTRVDMLVTIGYILGALLGLSLFERKVVYWMAAAYSMFFITWQVSSTVNPDLGWGLRLTQAMQRIWASIDAFFHNQPNRDTILFLALMGLLFWLIGITAGYLFTRHGRPWIPLLAAGLTLFVVDYNHSILSNRYMYSGAFALFSLLLLGRLYYLHSRREWVETGVSVDFETGYSLGRSMLVGGLILVLLAWNLPSVFEALTPSTDANSEFSSAWSGLKNRFSNAVSGLNNPVLYVSNTFSPSMALGNGAVLGEEVLFTAKTSLPPTNIRYYWRGYSYDSFDGKEWKNSVDTMATVSLDKWPLEYPLLLGRRKVDVIYNMRSGTTRVAYAPSMLLSLDRPASLIVEEHDNGDFDVISALSNTAFQPGDTFKANVWVSSPTVNQLKEAGQDYPGWVRERYLELPANFSERVKATAQEIVTGQETPYDQTMAITQYLRDHITYEKTVPNPPAGQDLLEWFLLDYKKGYCNYYATAEVLMLRSIGIPARIAVGYAQGEYDDVAGTFTVRVSDSHAWPEVYFPGAGWVEFEPTTAQPGIDLPVGDTGTDQGYAPSNPLSSSVGGPNDPGGHLMDNVENVDIPDPIAPPAQFPWWIFPAALFGGAALILLWLRLHPEWLRRPFPIMLEETMSKRGLRAPIVLQYWVRQSLMLEVERKFERVSWMLWLLGRKVVTGETPAEQMAALVKLAPETSEPARALLDEYHRAEYSQHTYDLTVARSAYAEIWRLVLSSFSRRILNVSPES